MRQQLALEVVFIFHRFAGMQAGLEFGIEIFIGVQIGTVRRQEEQLYMLVMVSHPLLDLATVMHLVIIEDQEDFAVAVFYQAFEEVEENLGLEGIGIEHEADLALGADGRNHVEPMALVLGQHQYGRFSLGGIPFGMVFQGADAGFIAKENLGFFLPGFGLDSGIHVLQPAADLGWIPLQGPFDGALGGEPPTLQIQSRLGGIGQEDGKVTMNQIPYRLGSPQGVRQAQLVRSVGGNLLENSGFLGLSQTAPGTHAAASFSFRSAHILADPGKPFTDCGTSQPQHLGNVGRAIALGMQPKDDFAHLFPSGGAQFAHINTFCVHKSISGHSDVHGRIPNLWTYATQLGVGAKAMFSKVFQRPALNHARSSNISSAVVSFQKVAALMRRRLTTLRIALSMAPEPIGRLAWRARS